MVLDLQTGFNIIIGILIAGTGWWAKEIWNALSRLRQDIHTLEVSLPHEYVQKDDFQEGMREIKEMLSKIFDRLDAKADKN